MTVSTTATAAQILAAAQAQVGSPVQASVAQGFSAAATGLSPQFPAAVLATERKPAVVVLPQLCTSALHLQDVASGATVDISLNGALPIPAQTVGGYAVYPAALAGATVLHRALPGGSEDFVQLPTRLTTPEVDYSIALGTGIAGLRLVGGTLEMLDSTGAPRLHVSPPFIVGADGVATDATLAVSDCAVDSDPSAPWGRAVTAPGASTCTVRVTWPDAAVAYPAILDPRWTTTGSMGTARIEHTIALLSTGRALVAGGRSSTTGTTGLTSAELYDPTSGTWSATGSLANGRRLHSMTQLGTSSNSTTSGKVLVAGGINGTSSLGSAELYSPSAGTWIAAGNLDVVRHAHSATLLTDGRVLIAGGMNGTATVATASLYNPASGAGSWVATTGPIPPTGLKNHTATLIQTTNTQLNNHVLLVGGNNGTSTISAVYLFDPVQNAFSTLASISSPREQSTAATLQNTNGKILVAGGKNGSTVLASAIVFDPSVSNGTWSSAGTMTSARVGHSMTLLPSTIVANGQVLVAGGSSTGSNALSTAELFSGTSTWTATPSMPGPMNGHAAVLLSGNSILTAGGSNGTNAQTTAFLYDASFGLSCTSNSQCSSGFCANGVCCNNACNTGTCGACNLAGSLGTCTALPSGTVCRAAAGACDVAETCNGTAMTCPSDSLAASGTVCRAAAGECDVAETCSGTSAACPADAKKASGTACTDDGNPCTKDQCDGTTVTCQHPVGNAGAVCRAAAGVCDVAETCTGSSATCPADHFAPSSTVCRASTGACDVAESCTGSSASCPADGKSPDGTTCNDGSACTQTDKCQAGTCVGSNPVICTAQDQCHTAGTCNPTSGACSNPPIADGTTCNDGNACTTSDTCHAGTCSGTAVTCTAEDQCHVAGTCNPTSGACSNPPIADGTTCNDGNACTTSDACHAGACSGTAVTCTAQDQCHVAGTCNPTSGACSNPPIADGTTCNDGNACTTSDSCHAGACSGTAVTCAAQDQCHTAGTCNPTSGVCSNPTIADGTTCNDGNSCTTNDACHGGSCSGTGSCASVTITEDVAFVQTTPQLSTTVSTTLTTPAVPGDVVPFSSTVTNIGIFFVQGGGLQVTNSGSSPFTIGAFDQTIEYFSTATQTWVPVGKVAFDATGTEVDDPTLTVLQVGAIFGTVVPPGPLVQLNYPIQTSFPAATSKILFDSTQASQVRSVLHLDAVGTAFPDTTLVEDLTATFQENSGTVSGTNVLLFFFGGGLTTQANLSSTNTTLNPGDTTTFTGTCPAPALPPRAPDDTDASYLHNLGFNLGFGNYAARAIANAHGAPTDPGQVTADVQIPWQFPILNVTKSGPAQQNAGLPLQYTVALQNVGTAVAGPFTLSDTVNGTDIGAQVTLPPPVAGGAIGNAIVATSTPLNQPQAPVTDVAVVTWQDRNGNVYGPISSNGFTTNITAGHPEGYLTLVGPPAGAPEILGSAATFTATALDGLGHPVPNLSISFTISGVNGQTVSVLTGADGTASFSYDGPNLGRDTVTATATINGPALQASVPTFTWAATAGGNPPCTGRDTPLDVMLVIDASPSMFSDDQISAAEAATNSFIGDLDLSIDQVGSVVFSGDAPLAAQLTSNVATVTSETNSAFSAAVHACDGFCAGGSNFQAALQTALTELQSPRHRAGAQTLIVFLSDGGNTGVDPTAEIAAVKAAGVRIVALAFGSAVNVAEMRQIASSTNDYFYAPSVAELGWIYGNIDQNACRTTPPLVSAGGNQGMYEARLPDSLTLQGEAHGTGPRGDLNLVSTWSEISGPASVAFADASSPVTDVLFTAPGTYVLQLEATDGFLTTADRATITVDPAPSLTGANLAVSLSAAGPLTVGTPETLTAVLTDAQANPIGNFLVQVTVTGANPTSGTASTNASGVATFTYVGTAAGTDVLQAVAIGGTAQLPAAPLSVSWTHAPPGGGNTGIVSQGWIGAPGQRARVMGLVPITVAAGVTVASANVSYWPANTPTNIQTLATTAVGGPGATLATLDTTTLLNGSYIIDVSGTDNQGNQQDNEILVTVAGDYKPGREVVDVTEFTVPVAGNPITIGRHYDSLNKDQVSDFGNGWSLTISHPDLEVDQANDVTITLPNGRRSTFIFELQPLAAGPVVLGFLAQPLYVPEPGVFGTLTSDGCNLLAFDPTSDSPTPICFGSLFDPVAITYAPTTYTYTDPFGTVYTMGAAGTLKSVQDRNNNVVTFTPEAITASTGGRTVTFTRDGQGRITSVTTPPFLIFTGGETTALYTYTYDTAGNLVTAQAPDQNVFSQIYTYTYDGSHRLLTTTDPAGHPSRTSTFDAAGRLASDTDALGNVTSYVYDVSGHTTTTTYPDTGIMTQTFDDRGLLLLQTDQLGRTTTHQYDANRNETKRINALGEATTYTYDANGNQTSSTNALGETTTTTYNAFSEAATITDAVGNTTTIGYDDSGLPISFTDSIGPVATFASSEHGLPTSVTDAAENTVYLNYDSSGDLTFRTDRLGRVTSYLYDDDGRKTAMIDPRGGTTTYSYNAEGDLLVTANPLGFGPAIHLDANRNKAMIETANDQVRRTENYAYDADNHLVSTSHGDDGTTIAQAADFRGNVLSMTDELGHPTSYSYDLAGQLVQTTYADGTFATQAYDALGRPQSKTDERGNTTTYAYEPGCDCSDRLISVTDPLGRMTATTYDGMSRKTSTTDAAGHQTFYAYDLRGNLIETDYADGTAVRDTYDALGRRTASTDQTAATTRYGYDAEGELVSVTDPLQNVTQYAYDASGNLTAVTDANNHTTTYAYDAANRKIGRTLPLEMTETFGYDADNNQISHTDFRGKTATYTFDRRYPGRLVAKVPDPSLGEPTVVYTLNSTGTRSGMTDASGSTTYGYDTRNRLLTKVTPEGTLTYTYDPSGNVASINSSNANGTSVGYAWDAADQLVSVTDNRLGGITTAAYTATGRPTSLAQPNGVAATYAYDSLERVTSMAWKSASAPPLASWAYTYNARGQRLTATDVTGREATYGYDAASRLASETITGDLRGTAANGVLTYSLDGAGNRLTRTSTLGALAAQTFEYDANDELSNDSYDANGSTTNSAGHSYAYDFEGRLVSKDDGTVTVIYDGDGDRVAKATDGVTTRYLVDDLNPTGYLQVLEEGPNGTVTVRYTYGNTLVSQTRSANDMPVASFYGYDAHGNVTFLTDETGVTTDTYNYDGWGVLVASTGSTANNRLYTGEEFDEDLGLVNTRARYYKPTIGRFISPDATVGQSLLPITYNRYLFADSDPIDRLDPSGQSAVADYGIILAAVAAALLVEETVRIGNNGQRATVQASGAASALGVVTACNYASAIIGTNAALGIYNLCTKKRCPPCGPPPPPRIDSDHSHYPCPGAHMHTYVMNQNPVTCKCYPGKGPVICL